MAGLVNELDSRMPPAMHWPMHGKYHTEQASKQTHGFPSTLKEGCINNPLEIRDVADEPTRAAKSVDKTKMPNTLWGVA
jgi:hypothetical protein